MCNRILGYDLLRGLCSILIVFYHIMSWQGYSNYNNIGCYCVYIFFIISGASLYYSFADKIKNLNILKFLALRYIRLLPLFVLALFLSIYTFGLSFLLLTYT
jgi:peptidoglycan/LPS O-acetylase OafA/YrhL